MTGLPVGGTENHTIGHGAGPNAAPAVKPAVAEPGDAPAVGGEPAVPVGAQRTVLTVERRPPTGERAWLLTLLPGFPLLLLVLRVWYLSRQDLQTMLIVLQSANPLGLIASLLISLLWALPAMVLLLRALYLLLLVSEAPRRSWLARAGVRTPNWVSIPAVVLAVLTWQLRFLPTLLMLALVIAGLEVRHRFGGGTFAAAAMGTSVPVAIGLIALAWLAPAIRQSFGSAGEPLTALLLVAPPLAAPLLCGPIPARVARWLLPGLATLLALTTPILLGNSYLRTPVLPRVAVEYRTPSGLQIQRGSLVNVDDDFITVLDSAGKVHFVLDSTVKAQVLCSVGPAAPTSTVSVHGWQVEQSVLSWAAPAQRLPAPGPNRDCLGS